MKESNRTQSLSGPRHVSRLITGYFGEDQAAKHLERLGGSILARNVRTPHGEIDLIVLREGVIVFVEVKTRRNRNMGSPEESIRNAKRNHMILSAQYYLQQQNLSDTDWRIDVVAVEINASGGVHRLEVIENAVHG